MDEAPETAEPTGVDLLGQILAIEPGQVGLEQVPPLGDDLREARYSPWVNPEDSVMFATSSASASSVSASESPSSPILARIAWY